MKLKALVFCFLLLAAACAPSGEIVERVFEEIDRFAGAAPRHDDITLLVLAARRRGRKHRRLTTT